MSMSFFDQAWDATARVYEELFGKAFVYRRTTGETIDVLASVSIQEIEVQKDNGIWDTWRGYVFTVASDQLKIGDVSFVPVKGDKVLEPIGNGHYHVYEAMPPAKGRVYNSIDPENIHLNVYMKQIQDQ